VDGWNFPTGHYTGYMEALHVWDVRLVAVLSSRINLRLTKPRRMSFQHSTPTLPDTTQPCQHLIPNTHVQVHPDQHPPPSGPTASQKKT
jgi:hypothetical protein